MIFKRKSALVKAGGKPVKDGLGGALEKGAIVIFENRKYVTVRYPKIFKEGLFILLLIFGVTPAAFYLLFYLGTPPKEHTFMK